MVSFFEESFFEFEKQLSRDKDLLYKLMFVLDTGKDSLDLISAQCFLRIYRWLVSFYANIPEGRQTKDHEILSDLSNQILKRIVDCKLLIKRLRLNAYETLSSFDYVIDCNYESYFSFLGSLLQSPISKEYAKYSGKILALIVSRIEKEYVNLRMSRESSTVTKICDCFQLVKHVIEIKGVLDDEYSAIETELAKILLYLKAPHKIDFDHYVLSIASKIVKTAGSHLTLLDPVIASLPQIFESNTFEIQTLYELFYAYILKDSNFALKENLSKISNLTKGINANDQTSIMKQEKESLSAFATINRILIITIEKSQNVSLESFEMAMFLIILEFQVYNEAGLLTTFKEILDKLLVLQIDLQSRLNLVEFSESTFKRYVWVSLALLNALHYYFEDVMGPYVQTGFIDNFIEKGLEIIIKASPSFPPVLSKLFRLCLLRLLGSGNNLKLSDNTILGLFQLITDLLFNDISREDTLRRVPDQFIGNKISKKFKSGLSSNVLKDQNDLNHLFISLSSIPDHQENDFYSSGINLYGYLQTIYRQMKEQLPALSELLKSNFTAEDISKLEQILSVRIINGSTDIFKSSKSSNHDYQQKSFSAPTPRKIAKVVRNNQ